MSTSEPDWAQLFLTACDLIRQADIPNADWTFGGGTAMMLQIEHRENHDVDIFLSDPQYLALFDPQKNDFTFNVRLAEYKGDQVSPTAAAFPLLEIGLRKP